MTKPDYIFVYGTLRRGFNHPAAALLARYADFIGLGTVQGKLYDLGSYPGLIVSAEPDDLVFGDVYLLRQRDQLLAQLDQYEEYFPDQPDQSLYLRQKLTVLMENKESHPAWVYVYNHPVRGYHRIESGDYLEYLHDQTFAAKLYSKVWLRARRHFLKSSLL